MPRRKPAYRRVTPLSSRRETQRRAALAILALVIVVGGLGLGVYAFGGNTPQQAISSANAGQKALDQAKADLAKVSGAGIDLVTDDPNQALELLTDAHGQLDGRRGREGQRRLSSRRMRTAGRGRSRPAVRRRAGRLDRALHVQAGRRCPTRRPLRHGPRA